MTPGQEALREAMRWEQARIYGQLQREHSSTDSVDNSGCVHTSVAPAKPPASNVTHLAPPRKGAA